MLGRGAAGPTGQWAVGLEVGWVGRWSGGGYKWVYGVRPFSFLSFNFPFSFFSFLT